MDDMSEWVSDRFSLTHWGRVTHICVGKLNIIGSYNGLSYGRHQAIIWTNAGILLIKPVETNFSEILIGIQRFSFKKSHLKMSSAKWRPFYVGLNVLRRNWNCLYCCMPLAPPTAYLDPTEITSVVVYDAEDVYFIKVFNQLQEYLPQCEIWT